MGEVGNAHNLATGMHRELGHPSIDHPNSRLGAEHRTDRTPARTVVADHKFVDRHLGNASNFPHEEARDAVRGVSGKNVSFIR